MTDTQLDIADIKLTLKMMKEHIRTIETKLDRISPQCFTQTDDNVPLSAAKSMWPFLEKEFDEYCTKHGVTTWTPDDNTQFFNEYIGAGADWPTNDDTQKG